MSYKTVLVQGGLDEDAGDRVLHAARIAGMFEGVVLGVGAEPCDLPSTQAHNAAEYQSLLNEAQGRLNKAEDQFRKVCRAQHVESAWAGALDSPRHAISAESRGADLVVTLRNGSDDVRSVTSIDDIIMESGLPVLVGPQDNEAALDARNIIVAWKDTRECRRAIWDALPFLKRAKMVFLLHIIEGGDQADAETALQSVARRLERHGVLTEIHVVEAAGARTSDSLCDGADRHGADLIVIGAYGHSRLREWVLGGVTQDFVNYASQFVLFSH